MLQSSASDRIYESIRSRIDSGAIRAGEKLPSTRSLAADLGVSRSTVVTIYEQLAAEGYIETAAGARARVSLGLKPLPPKRQPSAVKRPDRVASIAAYGKRVEGLALPQPPVTDPAHINFLYGAIADEDFPTLALKPPRKPDPGGSREFQPTESLREEIQIQ